MYGNLPRDETLLASTAMLTLANPVYEKTPHAKAYPHR
jgi:hypothetical protein